MTMTAAEIHALAEPLFKAWPACKPKGLGWFGGDDGCFTAELGVIDEGCIMRCELDPPIAAALIRVAIEDAMATSPTVGGVELCEWWIRVWWNEEPVPPIRMWACLWDGSVWQYSDFTFDHDPLEGLVAAALAVAESRKTTTP